MNSHRPRGVRNPIVKRLSEYALAATTYGYAAGDPSVSFVIPAATVRAQLSASLASCFKIEGYTTCSRTSNSGWPGKLVEDFRNFGGHFAVFFAGITPTRCAFGGCGPSGRKRERERLRA